MTRALRLVARLTASAEVGLGHFVRCRALAEQNRANGGTNVLVAEAMTPWLETWAASVFTREIIGAGEGAELAPDRWREIVARHAADAVVFDHYGVSAHTHRLVATFGPTTLAIDDVPARPLAADVVLNQNLGVREDDYRNLVPASTRLLIGPRYALVSHDVRRARVRPAGESLRVLISFGGGRHGALVDDVLTAIASLPPGADQPRLAVTVVASDVDGARWPSAGAHAVRIVAPTPGLASALAEADIAIGAPGSTTYERLALGVPSVLVQLSDNQAPVARGLLEAGAAIVLGRRENVTVDAWIGALRRVCRDATARRNMAAVGRGLVDGCGTERVLDALSAAMAQRSPSMLKVRRVSAADASLLWEWRNDETVRRNSFSTERIAWEDHQRWLAAQLASPAVAMFVLEDADEPVAQVRYVRRDADEAEVHISVAASARGRGYGQAALTESVGEACAALGVRRVVALIKAENAPSVRAFDGAGFEPAGLVTEHGARCHKYVYRAPEAARA